MTKKEGEYQSNELIERLPKHLKQFIQPQNYENYSPIDQAVWRYVMRKSLAHLSKVAHHSYAQGLLETGIEIDSIPSMYGMNRILKKIGWAAVAVDGFIPPNAFMEFQAYKVLVIAADIRQLENIEYTPAPDIIHEAAGHAPIIANPDYAEYLRRLGAIGAKAILSRHDVDLYEAVRKLSILKEAGNVDGRESQQAEYEVKRLQDMKVPLSEMAQMRNLQWWSVEYGLIGAIEEPKIYGAGLLSSIGESKWCMSPEVKKLPYNIDVVNQGFDITKPQPQLYVTPDFSHLMEVLEEFANSLSLRKGGTKGILKLVESQMVGTIELSTGLQISGEFSEALLDEDNEVIFFKTNGPTALAYREKELIGQGIQQHQAGFCSPLGKLKNINLAIEDMGPYDLKAYDFYDGKWLSFEYESGIKVEGMNVTGIRSIKGKLMLIQLQDCTITYGSKVLYEPQQGMFHMVVGKDITSAYAGAADHNSFPNLYKASPVLTIKKEKTVERLKLESLYARAHLLRNSNSYDATTVSILIQDSLKTAPDEWLLLLNLHELSNDMHDKEFILNQLDRLSEKSETLESLISEGLFLAENSQKVISQDN